MAHVKDKPPTLKQASRKDFPDYVEKAVAVMLEKSPDDRFPTVAEARSALLGEKPSARVARKKGKAGAMSKQRGPLSLPVLRSWHCFPQLQP